MLRYVLTEDDVGSVRFGISPLCELGLSLAPSGSPPRFPLQLGWLRRTEEARARPRPADPLALIDERMWTPDFLNPRPDVAAHPSRRRVRRRSSGRRADVFRRDLEGGARARARGVRGIESAALRRIVRALTSSGTTCFEPYWPRMRAVLEADVVYRGRQIAQSAGRTGCSTASRRDRVRPRRRGGAARAIRATASRRIDGNGLTLVPTMFTRRASAPVGDGPPMIMYSARGQGALWEAERVANPAAVAAVLGETRASLLAALGDPGVVDRARRAPRRHRLGREPAPAGAPRRRPARQHALRAERALPAQRTRQALLEARAG